VPGRSAAPREFLEPPAQGVSAQHESLLARAGLRKRAGAYYTPSDVVAHLLDLALAPILHRPDTTIASVSALRLLDPACGTGNFLVAAGERLQQRLESLGLPAPDAAAIAYGQCLVGVDIDATAIDLCTERLAGASRGAVTAHQLRDRVRRADALELATENEGLIVEDSWQALQEKVGATGGFDLVVGNPPFLSQLASDTTRPEAYARRLLQRFGHVMSPLTDTSALFLALAVDIAKPQGGVVCMIQPISILSARDAAPAREAVLSGSAMRAAWLCEDKVFDASVRVCAPVLVRGDASGEVELYRDRAFAPSGVVPPASIGGGTWSGLLAAAKGMPDRILASKGTVGDIASATADFRNKYYGLRGCVVDLDAADDTEFPPLVTSGLLDPGRLLWGSTPTRFDKTGYLHPRIDLSRLDRPLLEWAKERLCPKLMLATQTKVLEAFVDVSGRLLPSVPVITVTAPEVEDLWRLGALLSSPPITLVSAYRHLGAALSSDALKLSARDVLGLPLPADPDAWHQAGKHFEAASLAETDDLRSAELCSSAALMCRAFGLADDDELMAWWARRLPCRRKAK